MPRPCKKRRVCKHPDFCEFVATESQSDEVVLLTIDEFECLRLVDYEMLTQEECAAKMTVARTTVTLIYQEARRKLMDALLHGKKLVVRGGNYHLCPNHQDCGGFDCLTEHIEFKNKENNITMRIAITHQDGQVFGHFGRTEQFKIYDVDESGKVIPFILESNGAGHSALADLLARGKVDVLICGGIGGGAVNALSSFGIKVYAGASGACDDVFATFMSGNLSLDGASNCNHHHHEEGHDCHCGEHHHGEGHNCHCH